ncbi:hypothetical protein FGIG_00155 [Fasciola gigantica]|uniref:14-3-3 domain-containing protein n=1 Tax=Fasciola gigantica TaxID=46835 RepID=A0A504WSS7_FASGI|nr:hypothetical protein FGIG_00155 [Fasciola gigantica]
MQLARLAGQATSFTGMAAAMRGVAEMQKLLGNEEQGLCSVANKNVAGALRSAWRLISSMKCKNADDGKPPVAELWRNIEQEL